MNQQVRSFIIALVIIWNLEITMSASHAVPSDGQSSALNLLLEMLVKSNQDLADTLDKLQETVTTHASAIDGIKLQLNAIQSVQEKEAGSNTDKHYDDHICEALKNQIESVVDRVSIVEENQAVCERYGQSARDEVEKKLSALDNDITTYKLKQQEDETRLSDQIESLESEISELQQNDVGIMSSLSETKYDVETNVKRIEKEVSDLGTIINKTDARHGENIAKLIRDQTKYKNKFVDVQDEVDKIVTDMSEIKDRILNIEEQYETIKDDVKADIKRENRNEMVAFSAHVSPSYTDIQPGTTIVFSQAHINTGQGYNPKSGEFRAPIAGVYVFYSNILTGANKSIETRLVINGEIKLWLYSSGGQHMGPGSNLLVTHLEKDDIVKMMKYGPWGVQPFYIHNVWSTFSGFLLVPDI